MKPARLRLWLVIGDSGAILASWLPAELVRVHSTGDVLVGACFALVQVGLGVALLGAHRLYRARNAAIPKAEIRGLTRVAALTATSAWLFDRWWWSSRQLVPEAAAAGLCLLLLHWWRGGYAHWLRSHRQRGLYARRVLVVGNRNETDAVVTLFTSHPELGYIPFGMVEDDLNELATHGDPPDRNSKLQERLKEANATGVILCGTVMSSDGVNGMIECLHASGIHVQLFSGLMGIDHRRIRPLPVAHEPLFYLEPRPPRRPQESLKRVIDVVGASVILVVSSPVLLVAALMIKLQDRGPVFFRQERLGRDGRPFMIIKFRTMVSDAELMVEVLADENIRTGGPLFKIFNDPRVTRVGCFLRESSIDELPQLINVLRGEMSLVGPRPALASETEQFDQELLRRLSISPGVTGLWQVEAQDNPSFFAYRHLDLFYTENWSPAMDLAILAATFQLIMTRLVQALVRIARRRSAGEGECRGEDAWLARTTADLSTSSAAFPMQPIQPPS